MSKAIDTVSPTRVVASRRSVGARETAWARRLAAWLGRRCGVTPNQISLASVGVAALASAGLVLAGGATGPSRIALLAVAMAAIQLRLLCNLLDGLMAIEGGRATRTGALYNELPDRVSDVFVLVGAGYSVTAFDWGPAMGWMAAVVALITAYVRALGNALGVDDLFRGPMAKPQRMAAVTAACAFEIVDALLEATMPRAMALSLVLIAGGGVVTIAQRVRRIVRVLEAR